jgi:endonuclease-3
MLKKNKAQFIQKTLTALFPHPEIPLKHDSPFTLLIAVLLSAQCTDQRVNQVTPLLFTRANTAEKMCQLSVEEITELIRTCGLYRLKAKAIRQLSEILVQKYAGKVPRSWKALEALPGVGHKTASVVMVQAFHMPAFPVDTHIHRLAKRWGLSNGASVVQTEKDLKRLFPKSSWAALHLQMIYYGRTHCPARGHRLDKCPICEHLNL